MARGELLEAFMPAKGDVVEFLSDRQTEKGPSAGTVVGVDHETDLCQIRHSDVVETFMMKRMLVKKHGQRESDGKLYWCLF